MRKANCRRVEPPPISREAITEAQPRRGLARSEPAASPKQASAVFSAIVRNTGAA